MSKIKLVNDLYVDIDDIPNDFADEVRAAFEKYTEGTREDYRHEDKLAFIDLCVRRMRGNKDEDEIVKGNILENVEWKLDQFDELPDTKDYNAIEFMRECARAGRENAQLHFCGNEGRTGEKKMKVLDLILSALYSNQD